MLISYHRGVLAASINEKKSHPKGGMMAASLTPQEAEKHIARLVHGKLSIACVNSPTSVTFAGDVPAVDELQIILNSEGVFNRKLRVDVAYHSSHMQVVADEYLAKLSNLKVGSTGKCDFYSSVTGDKLDSSKLGSQYWVDNMLSKVRFAEAVKVLCLDNVRAKRQQRNSALNVDLLIEIGPHAALSGPIKEIIKLDPTLDNSTISYRSVLYRDKDAAMTALDLACSLFETGYNVNFSAINRPNTPKVPNLLVDLPPFAWDHSKRYWAESRVSKQLRLKSEPRADLLGTPSADSTSLEPKWRNMLRSEEIPWVRDHKVHSNIVYPGAAYICSAIEAASRRATANGSSVSGYKLRNVVIRQALIIPEESADIEIMVSLRPLNESAKAESKTWDEFCVQSLSSDGIWVENCRGLISTLRPAAKEEEGLITHDDEEQAFYAAELTSLTALCQNPIDTRAIYKGLADLGLEYGPTFANMNIAAASPGACVATVTIADTAATMPSGFQYPHIVHPSTLDALLHTVFPCDVDADGHVLNAIILMGIDEIFVSNTLSTEPGYELLACTRTSKVDDQTREGTTYVFGQQEQSRGPLLTIKGIKYIPHNKDARDEAMQDDQHAMHEFIWKPDVTFPVTVPKNLYPPLVVPSEEVERLLALQKAAYYYAESALGLISLDEVKEDHHQALYRWMLRIVDKAKNNEFEYPSDDWVAATAKEREDFLHHNSNTSDEARLLAAVGTNLTDILRGSIPPLSVIMEDGMLGKFYQNNITGNGPLDVCPPYVDYLAHKNPHLRILEIGAGTGGMTSPVLHTLGGQDGTTPRFTEYSFTDISSGFFEAAKERFKEWSPLITFQKLDIEIEPSQQGFPLQHYDVVIAHNVLHATTQIKRTLRHVRSLVKPGGRLLLSEITGDKPSIGLVWGTLPGWWAGRSEGRLNGPLLTEDEWSKSLQVSGFSGLDLTLWKSVPYTSLRQGTFMVAQATEPKPRLPGEITLVTEDGHNDVQIDNIKSALQEIGSVVHTTRLADVKQASKQFFLVLSELTGPILKSPSEQQFEALKILLCDCEGVLWVTRGSSMTPNNPDASLFIGLANSLRTEVGGGAHISLDLDDRSSLDSEKTTKAVVDVFNMAFDLGQPDRMLEVSYAERGGIIYIPRVVDHKKFQTAFAVETQPPVATDQPYHQEGRPLAPKVRVPGLLDTIYFDDDPNTQEVLADDYVRIQVMASGLNFRDIMTSMGQIKLSEMGFEAAGVIAATGKDVHDLQIGDRVITVGHNLLTNVAYVPASHALKFPDTLSFEKAAAIPIVYTTAYFCLFDIARVARGDKVLVHAAAGGLGHAAIDVCRYAGAEIFATVSSKEKKALLMNRFGIPEDHIFSSRKSGFGAGILRASGGTGVDIVLNSTSGDFIRESMSCVAPYGRFIELGRYDFLINSRLEMEHMARNVSFIVTDLLLYLDERPALVMAALQQVLKLIESGQLNMSLPVTEFLMSEMESALRTMQTGRHTGKLVVVQRKDVIVKVILSTFH
jgi:NADPH:quinone reductase-like Zn-dependent oxidoreductase/SAM-dependent methyltransferase